LTSLNQSINQNGGQIEDENIFAASPFLQPQHLPGVTPLVPANLVGSDLTASDYSALDARWIDRDLADCAHLRRVDSMTGGEIVGRKGGNYAGIIIPYFLPGSDRVREYRLRRDQPDLEYDSAGNLKSRQKYLSPPGQSNMLYVVPGTGRSLLNDPGVPIIVTEGEFKTLALWRLANHGSPNRPRFLPLGVSGVYNWRGTIGKTVGPDGSRQDVKGAIRDLDWITWDGRHVVIAYDADAATKEVVRIARSELTAHFATVGPETVLDAIANANFASTAWKKDLLRSRPPTNTTEGRVLPVLANAIAAFRHAPASARVRTDPPVPSKNDPGGAVAGPGTQYSSTTCCT